MENKRRKIRESNKAVDGFESENKVFVMDVEMQQDPVERCEEWYPRIRVARGK